MGGGLYRYPKDVWSPTGGWWPQPRHWLRNTAIAGLGLFAFGFTLVKWSFENEVRENYLPAWIMWNCSSLPLSLSFSLFLSFAF